MTRPRRIKGGEKIKLYPTLKLWAIVPVGMVANYRHKANLYLRDGCLFGTRRDAETLMDKDYDVILEVQVLRHKAIVARRR